MSDRGISETLQSVLQAVIAHVQDDQLAARLGSDIIAAFAPFDIDFADLLNLDPKLDRLLEAHFNRSQEQPAASALHGMFEHVLAQATDPSIRTFIFTVLNMPDGYGLWLVGSPLAPYKEDIWREADLGNARIQRLPDALQKVPKDEIEQKLADEVVAYCQTDSRGAKKLKAKKHVCVGFEGHEIFIQDRIKQASE